MGRRLVSMANYYSPDFRPLCRSEADLSAIDALVRHITNEKGVVCATFEPLDEQAQEVSRLALAFGRVGWFAFSTRVTVNWRHRVSGDYAEYLSTRPGRIRNTLSRRRRQLERQSGFAIHIQVGEEGGSLQVERSLEAYLDVYTLSWKPPEPHPDFMPALIREMSTSGELRLGVLWLGSRPVAVQCWFVHGRSASIFKLAHDPEFVRFSPGTVLLAAMIEHVIDHDGVHTIDFLTGDDVYKRDWMSERCEKVRLTVFDPRSPGGWWEGPGRERVRPRVRGLLKRLSFVTRPR